jgi:putative protein-disulfide isomerase
MPALYYVHDPMCSWCWAFRPAYDVIIASLPAEIHLTRLLGGLATDTDEPMPTNVREYVQNHWHTIQKVVPGTEFNFTFWDRCQPRRATYPACRAVIAARKQGDLFDDKMTHAIQQGYYLQARNPSDHDTLIEFADEIGLDTGQFTRDLSAPDTNTSLNNEIVLTRQLGVTGFPGLLIGISDRYLPVPVDYLQPENMLKVILETVSQ